MEPGILEKKIAKLPENLKLKAEGYIDALLDEAKVISTKSDAEKIANRGFGSLKGKIWMSDDFDVPLEDFKDYM